MSWFSRFRDSRRRLKLAGVWHTLGEIQKDFFENGIPVDEGRVRRLLEKDASLRKNAPEDVTGSVLEFGGDYAEADLRRWFSLSPAKRIAVGAVGGHRGARDKMAVLGALGLVHASRHDDKKRGPLPELPNFVELEDMLRGGYDEERAIVVLNNLVNEGNTPRALRVARQLTARFPENAAHLSVRIAEHLSTRGQNEDAWAELEKVRELADAPLEALLLAGELCENRGDEVDALRYYERLLARDIDYPKARERAIRLRKNQGPRPNLAGATIATEGAFTRGRWRIERELGRGGAGTVFSAHDTAVGRRVALKVYHRRGKVERARLIAEAQTPAALEHPGIIRIFDIDPELASIAMESVTGGSIRRAIDPDAANPISIARVRRWISTASEALAFVHQRGFVHRDIKPSNMLLRGCDQVVLTDFGLALKTGAEPMASGEGTLRYAPAEQRQNAIADPAADMFALGVTIDEILACLPKNVTRPEAWVKVAKQCQAAPAERPSADDVLLVFTGD